MDGDRRVEESGTLETPLCRMAGEIPGILWSTDCGLRITSCWGAGLADLDLRSNQLVGRTLADYFRTEDLDFPLIAAHRRALKGETVSVAQDWQGKVYQARIAPLQGERGRIVGCAGIAQEVTEQKRLEEALRQSERRARALLDGSFESIVLFDASGRIRDLNQAAATRLKRTRQELIGMSGHELFSPDVAARRLARAEEAVRRRSPVRYEEQRDEFVFDSVICPVFDQQGNLSEFIVSGRDITDGKRTEEALRQSEARVRALLNAPAEAMFLIDTCGRVMEVNETWARAMNRPARELVGTCVFDQFPPDLAERRREEVAEVTRTGKPAHCEDEYQGRIIESTLYPVFDRARKVIQIAVSARDVTERRGAQEAVRQSEARARALLNAPTDAMYLIDVSGRVVDVNQTGARMLNRSVEQLVGTCVYELFTPEVAGTRREKAERVVCTGKPLRFEDERNGRFFDSTVYPILDRDGKVIQVAVSARDITERKRTEEALRESKERYLAIFEQAADSIVLVDPDTGALVEFNDRTHQSLGYTRSEFETLTIADLEVLESAEQVAAHLQKVLDRGSDVFETKHRTKAGEIRDIQVNSKTISAGGREFVQSTWRDVTEQKRSQEALKRARDELEQRVRDRTAALMSANQKLRQEIAERERAEQALRESERRRVEAEKLAATGRLAARVAHEINNPLAGILSSLQLVKAAVPEGHRHYEYAELIEKEIDRIGRIVRQMLLVHRPDQETIQDVHVVETIGQVVAILAPNCSDRRLRVETRADPSEITIRIPEGSLRQILYNLLANAVEASPPGGTIKIGASMPDGGNAVEITVADPGEGIPEDVQDRVFEPFFTTKEEGLSGNVGLGLSISQGIIDSLGGALDFGTTPGKGTTFRVVLPSMDR